MFHRIVHTIAHFYEAYRNKQAVQGNTEAYLSEANSFLNC